MIKQGQDASDRQFTYLQLLGLKGALLKYESLVENSGAKKEFFFDGTSVKSYIAGKSRTDKNYPYGENVSTDKFTNTIELFPLIWFFRPLDASVSKLTAMDLKLDNAQLDIDGQQCLRLVNRKAREDVQEEYWINPLIDYAIVRHVVRRAGIVTRQWDIRYDEKKGSLVPTSWKYTAIALSDRQMVRSEISDVSSIELANAVDERLFDLAFPADTYVNDDVEEKSFIARNDGSIRPVQPAEKRLPYTTLLSTESGGSAKRPLRVLAIAVTLVIIVLTAAMAIIKRLTAVRSKLG